MSPVLLPPFTGIEPETKPVVDPEALIEEARSRQRHRRRRIAAVALALGLGALAFGLVRFVSGGGESVAESTPNGLYVNRKAFAGHGKLAFVSRGRLFVLDGKTQKLTAVTGPGQRASDPQFSPNSDWLTYTLGTRRLGLARGDGSWGHAISRSAGAASWLPNGQLLIGKEVFRIVPSGERVRVSAAPSGSVAWSSSGDRFAFVSRRITHARNGAFHGVERLEVSNSLTGKRTTWHTEPISFMPGSSFRGNVISGFIVLPHREGILFWVDPGQSASLAADGMSVYELRAPGARPVKLAVTVGANVSTAPRGTLAIGAGGDRYAWLTKNVETCNASTARCAALKTPAGELTLDPAWSPDGETLAFVGAARGTASDFRQATIARWYSTRSLWLLEAGGASRPTKLQDTQGAAAPAWSRDGTSLLYVSGDALWLIPRLGSKPEKIAGPLYPPNAWPSYYGQVGWTGQFAWSS